MISSPVKLALAAAPFVAGAVSALVATIPLIVGDVWLYVAAGAPLLLVVIGFGLAQYDRWERQSRG